jgi:hypothetical protein
MIGYESLMTELKGKGVVFDRAMNLEELNIVAQFYNISFPFEIQKLFSLGLPVSRGFYNWRDMSSENVKHIKNALEAPIDGLQFDLEENGFWCEQWGIKPSNIEDARNILLQHYNNAPKLVPLYSHRYMPFIPDLTRVPVFSIMQSDIIYYGTDLVSYLEIEFGYKDRDSNIIGYDFPHIDFWSDLL